MPRGVMVHGDSADGESASAAVMSDGDGFVRWASGDGNGGSLMCIAPNC